VSDRFFESPLWRFLISDLDHVTLSWLDRLASGRVVTRVLDAPSTIDFTVPSDNPSVNIMHTDDFPFVAEGVRLVHCFRHEETEPDIFEWIYRAGGILGTLTDNAESGIARTICRAYDPWWYLNRRPAGTWSGTEFTLPGQNGMSFSDTKVGTILATILRNTIEAHGNAYIDAGADWGGTTYWAGEIEDLPEIDYNIAQGRSVGDVWTDLTNQGYCDIILTPVYDPVFRPGILCDLSIVAQAGQVRDSAIFGWGTFPQSLVGINRQYDGSKRINVFKGYAGQGGTADSNDGVNIPAEEDIYSIDTYGEYWAQQFFPQYTTAAGIIAVEALIARAVSLAANGQQTLTISPAPERSPHPFTDYDLGDRVQVRASSDFRQPMLEDSYQRIYGFPVEISDSALESVRQMLTVPGTGA
jgi:hypothetical protein